MLVLPQRRTPPIISTRQLWLAPSSSSDYVLLLYLPTSVVYSPARCAQGLVHFPFPVVAAIRPFPFTAHLFPIQSFHSPQTASGVCLLATTTTCLVILLRTTNTRYIHIRSTPFCPSPPSQMLMIRCFHNCPANPAERLLLSLTGFVHLVGLSHA